MSWNTLFTMVEEYNPGTKNIEEELGIYMGLLKVVEEQGFFLEVCSFLDNMVCYMYSKDNNLKGVVCNPYKGIDYNDEWFGKIGVRLYTAGGDRCLTYNPFDKELLRLVIGTVGNNGQGIDHRGFLNEYIINQEIMFNNEKENLAIYKIYIEALNKDFNKNTHITNREQDYLKLLRENLERRVRLFGKEVGNLYNGYWEVNYKLHIETFWKCAMEEITDKSKEIIDTINKIELEVSKGVGYSKVLDDMYNTGDLGDQILREKYWESIYKSKGVENYQKNNQHLTGMSNEQKLMYIDSNMCTIIGGYYILLRAMVKEEGVLRNGKDDRKLCSDSVLYAIVKYIRNIQEHPLDYREYFTDYMYVLDVLTLSEVVESRGWKGSTDIYFNLDKYYRGIQHSGISNSLFKELGRDYRKLHVSRNRDGERVVLIYTDSKGSKYDESVIGKLLHITKVRDFIDDNKKKEYN